MRIDLPCCGFKNCRYNFDGNCTKPIKQQMCEYWYLRYKETHHTKKKPEPHWVPCSERLPDEDNRLDESGRQFSDSVLVSVLNSADGDALVGISQTIDGEWVLELPRHCKILAWMPLPSPYQSESEE